MNEYSIGKLSQLSNLNIETIRFYEKKGLLSKPKRKDSGFRIYADEYVKRIDFIKRAKALGFSLKEINELLTIQIEDTTTCDDIKNKLEIKSIEINNKISDLKKMNKSIQILMEKCTTNEDLGACPIIENLE
jgi:Hg(II)-responsive transcriptional regulator